MQASELTLKPVALGELASFEMGQSPDSHFVNDERDGVPFLQGAAEFGINNPQPSLWCSQPAKLCQTNDILISVRAPVGTLNRANQIYCIGRGLAAIRFNQTTLPDFGWHLLNYWAKDLRQVAQGSTFEAISKADLYNLQVIPFLKSEQHKIAQVLDTIDETIAHTENLINKLKLIKIGLLHDLFMYGLDKSGDLRDPIKNPEQFEDTPLGKIPKDWNVLSLEDCVQSPITYGIVQAGANVDNGVPYIRTGDMAGDKLELDGLLRTSQQIAAMYQRSEVRAGEIVCAIRATVGKVLEVPLELDGANLTQGTARIAPHKVINNHFLLWSFRTSFASKQFELVIKGTTFSEITLKDLRKLKFLIPSHRDEQDQIAEILDAHELRIQEEVTYKSKLQLQKQGLMDDLLTGRIRVNSLEKVSA